MNAERVVAVTGATGFLGIHLIAALAHAGARIRVLLRRDFTHELWRGISVEAVPGSLEDSAALQRLVTGADTVVHAAGLIKARDRAAFLRTNRDGTRAIAQAARRHTPACRFIAISSLAAREPQLSNYAASKEAGEAEARAAYADAPDRLVILRPPTIYGAWDRETLAIFKAASYRLVPVFGSGRIAVIHVTDAATAIARLAMGVGEAGRFSLADANPAGYSMAELLSEAARATGAAPHFMRLPGWALLAAGHASDFWGKISTQAPIFTSDKAREILHPDWSVSPGELLPRSVYQTKIAISDGFAGTAAWYKAAGWLR